MPVNAKSIAQQKLRRDLEWISTATAGQVPRTSDLDQFVAATLALLSFRTVGLQNLRYTAKQLEKARAFWKTAKQQLILQQVADALVAAQERHAKRAAAYAEKRLINKVLKPKPEEIKPEEPKPAPASDVPAPPESIWD
jgi:hypothetical protein